MSQGGFQVIHVGPDNVDETGFFCLTSRRNAEGYRRKRGWLDARFAEGLKLHMVKQNGRGFIEYLPGAYAWRAVEAAEYMVIHCLWVLGRSKGTGLGRHLLDLCVTDARAAGLAGVAAVTSEGNWLVGRRFLEKHGFEIVDQAPPGFALLVKHFGNAALPAFSGRWNEKLRRLGKGLTVLRSGQCPYIDDCVTTLRTVAAERGLVLREIEIRSAEEVRRRSPSPYGVFQMVFDGRLLSYHPMNRREMIKALDARRTDR